MDGYGVGFMTVEADINIPSVPWALVLGDVFIITMVIGIGIWFHGLNPLENAARSVLTIGPFVVGWLLVAPIAGVYRSVVRSSLSKTIIVVTIAWFVAAIVGSGLRSMPFLPGQAPLEFVAVTIGTGLLGLLPWRVATVLVRLQ